MKSFRIRLRIIASVALVVMVSAAWGMAPPVVNYQGYLTATDGSPLDTTVAMTFRMYYDSLGGSPTWIDVHSAVAVEDGLFNVRLGANTPLSSYHFHDETMWLGVTVGSNSEMTPRILFAAVPFAYRVGTVDYATGGFIIGETYVSDKLCVGPGSTNPGENAFAAGVNTTASGDWSSVGGGRYNSASGIAGALGGGVYNLAEGSYSAIGGGERNEALGLYSTVGGGKYNKVRGEFAVIGGGGGAIPADSNSASGNYAVIGGGYRNAATSFGATIGGGQNNYARGLYSVIGGGGGDVADSNSVSGLSSTITGGARNVVTGNWSVVSGTQNSASGDVATVGGGVINSASNYAATVSGGYQNAASGTYSAVAGGYQNSATNGYAMVGGGQDNRAAGMRSFAAGYRARANHMGSFVWGSSNNQFDSTASFGDYTFTVRAPQGARFYTDYSGTAVGVSLSAGGGAWNSLCDVNQKRLYGRVNTAEILEKITDLPLHEWSYKSQPEQIRHLGPTAQDFYTAFGYGDNNTTISTIDPAGVALGAIQELAKRNETLETEIALLRTQVQSLMAEMKHAYREK